MTTMINSFIVYAFYVALVSESAVTITLVLSYNYKVPKYPCFHFILFFLYFRQPLSTQCRGYIVFFRLYLNKYWWYSKMGVLYQKRLSYRNGKNKQPDNQKPSSSSNVQVLNFTATTENGQGRNYKSMSKSIFYCRLYQNLNIL